MWEQMERSPVLAAPGSNNFTGLIANSTARVIGTDGSKLQVLSDEDANDLCERYMPLVRKIAGRYCGRGINFGELESAGLMGLVHASRKFDPARGAFGAYAKHHIRGEILACFKPGKDAIGFGRSDSLNVRAFKDDGESIQAIDCLIDERPPPLNPDLSNLEDERERRVVLGRVAGESLREIGCHRGLSGERARQIETRALTKLRKTKDNYPLRVAPRDQEARRFRDEYLACKGRFSALQNRRGQRPPSRALLPFRSVKYPCRTYSKAEIEAYERGEI
jgi:RNA polymerase sigma factor (sigma-70 family)